MILRQMNLSDVEQVYQLACRTLDEKYAEDIFFVLMSGWPSGQIVAADLFGNIIGFIAGARHDRDSVTVMMFATDPEYRNRGVGGRLMEEFRIQTIIDGRHYIRLEVRIDNSEAIMFYLKRGFYEVEHLHGFYKDGGDAKRMMRHVNSNV